MLKISVGLLSIVFVLSSTGISFGQTQYGGDYTRTPSGGYVGGDSQPFGGTGRQDGLDRGHGTGLQYPR